LLLARVDGRVSILPVKGRKYCSAIGMLTEGNLPALDLVLGVTCSLEYQASEECRLHQIRLKFTTRRRSNRVEGDIRLQKFYVPLATAKLIDS
jgi:hypothetical protein